MEKKSAQHDRQRATYPRPLCMKLSLRFGCSQLVIRYGTTDNNYEMGYNPRKAAQVIAYYAPKTGERSIEFIKAIKLVYLGDRARVAWADPQRAEGPAPERTDE